jgi:putative transposase
MNSNQNPSSIQERLNQLCTYISEDPVLSSLMNQGQLQSLLQAGFGQLLQAALLKERQLHLAAEPQDRGNGFAPQRVLHIGTTPVNLQVPRTREGFYPALLPKHQRHLPEAYHDLLADILLQAKSFKAALRTMQALGLSYCPEQLEQLLQELDEQAKTFFTRPLHPDWLFLYIDAKIVQLKDEHQQVKKAVHFLVIGVSLRGEKELLLAQLFWGNEVLEAWRKVLIDLRNRGLTRVLMLITDDFSGLASLVASLLPHSDHQLCCVHLLRNAYRHLSPEDFSRFKQTWREIEVASSFESAKNRFLQLLDQLRPNNLAFVQHLQSRTEHYFTFMKYPRTIREQIRSTNLPEGINNLIENLRRNAGGHFHSEREARVKLKLLADQLYAGPWARISPKLSAQLQTVLNMFKHRFEAELTTDQLMTQTF